jgi:hypothetical protein
MILFFAFLKFTLRSKHKLFYATVGPEIPPKNTKIHIFNAKIFGNESSGKTV